ncbi:CRISPR-associated endonuclease Cas2 [Kamptonema animale CS-326]|jgi:hypothetical protein|uniref:CRISPR-associated endonuclease Cas2 n=1 Tax=Kamptonema animale TaxID=92934 RepID=UPI00232C65F1|nr:CRISPR-associated endonuclease Cas2 [Kamptonema animale]MDB9510072.1 CRISPR-associated endonuclease Cas2 [Kamptonema animale CS-326]
MVEIVAFGCEFWSGDVDAGVELELRSRLGKIIKPEEDSILFFPLCACCRHLRLSQARNRRETIVFSFFLSVPAAGVKLSALAGLHQHTGVYFLPSLRESVGVNFGVSNFSAVTQLG